jgi:hypothetical protein
MLLALLLQALWILVCFRRSKAIGGPLLVFFVQVFVNAGFSLILIPAVLFTWQHRDRSVPLGFDERLIYVALLFLVTTFAAAAFTAISALVLLKTRRWENVMYVRGGLSVLATLAVMALVHRPNLPNLAGLIFPLVFLLYFFFSKRVQRVFHSPKASG